jgi:hypothetical protein
LVEEIQVTISLYTFGGPKVLFVGRYDQRGSPHNDSLLFTPWRTSLKMIIDDR